MFCFAKVDWDWTGRPNPKLKWNQFELENRRFDESQHSADSCQICQVAKYTPIGKKKISSFEKPRLASDGGPIVSPLKRSSPKKICPTCKLEVSAGKSHPCTPNAAKRNIVEMISQQSSTGQEQILSAALKSVVNEKGGEPGEDLRLTGLHGGNPLSVTVGKPKKAEAQLITPQFMVSLQKKLNCSQRKLLMIARDFKKQGVKFEAHIREDLEKLSNSLAEYYTVESFEFEENVGKGKSAKKIKVDKDLVFLKDPAAFVDHIVKERGLDKDQVIVRVGLDGGQGSFKVMVSIFETGYDPEISFSKSEGPGSRLTGSQRMLVMALADDLPESYENMRIIVEVLKLNELKCCLASDLKLINALLGISSHSGKFSCCYCTGEMKLECGELRTFGSLAKRNAEFASKGSKMKDMQKYKNVIHPSLLRGEPGSTVLSAVPPPELHLMMGAVNWGLVELYEVMDENLLKEKMRTKGVSIRGYHGGGLDGVNSNLFLKHLDYLLEGAPSEAQPIKKMLSSLLKVMKSCFSADLYPSYKEDISRFREAAVAMITSAKQVRGKVLKATWKVHILACHVEPFLEEKQVGLGVFCEQTTEAAHCAMKPTLQRFKRKADHLLHGPRLKRACVDFSSKNV